MKQLKTLLSVLLLSLLIFSCSQNIQEEKQCSVKISFSGIDRKISPTLTFVNQVSEIKLYTETKLLKTWTSSEEESAFENADGEVIRIDEGNYVFTLKLLDSENSELASSSISKTIVEGRNELNFVLSANQSGFGQVNVKLNWEDEDKVASVKAGIFTYSDASVPVSGFDFEALEIDEEGTSAVYSKTDIPSGNYIIKFNLYSSEETGSVLIKNYSDVLLVRKDSTSSAEFTVRNINAVYKISYEIGNASWIEGFTPVTVYNANTIIVYPVATNIHLEGYIFEGWYKDAECTISAGSYLPSGSTGDVVLYPKWNETNEVSVSGLTVYLKGLEASEDNPTVIITDTNPSISDIATALKDKNLKITEINLDLSDCTDLQELPSSAFYNCKKLKSIILPESLTEIDYMSFYGCEKLESVNIPTGVTTLSSYCFSSCEKLECIEIPASVTSIDYSSFNTCSNLTNIVIDSENTKYKTGDNGKTILSKDGKELVTYPSAAGEVTLNYEIIGKNALSFSKVTKIILENNVKTVKNWAFSYTNSIESLYISSSVTNFSGLAIMRCPKLTEITVDSGNMNYKTAYNDACLMSLDGKTIIAYPTVSGELVINDEVEVIGEDAFYDCDNLTSIVFGANVKQIDFSAFYGCNGLKSITIPDSVETLGSNAFSGCYNIEIFTFGNGIKEIPSWVLSSDKIKSLVIPANIEKINSYAFYCSGLESIVFEDTENWKVSKYLYGSGNESIEIDVTDSEANVTYLTDTYRTYDWLHSTQTED